MNISQMFKASLEITAKTSGSGAIRALSGDIASAGKTADAVNKQMAGLNGGLRALAAGFGGVQVADFITDLSRATIQLDAFQAQLSIGFGKSNALELEVLRNTMRRLGIAQEESLGSAVRFTSAMKLSGQSIGEVNKNFEAASKLILSNKLSADGAERVFKAMQQTASKGKLMAEELNGQLGDTLAGFNGQLAAALGVTSEELVKQMADGKISAERFFEALQKIGDGIDESALNSAARSLGNMKNQWFEFKTSLVDVGVIKAALDGTAAAFKFLADNALTLTSIVKGLAVGFGGLMVARMLAPIIGGLSTAIWALTFSFRTYGIAQTFAINGAVMLRAAWTALAANPIGIALTVLATIFGVLAMQTKAADEAAGAFGRAQSAIAGVIDITTGKINTQNAALLENARLLAKTSLLKAREAETEARGNFERRIGGTGALIDLGTFGSSAMTGQPSAMPVLQGKAEVEDFVKRMKAGDVATADVGKGWDSLMSRFPGLKKEYGDVTKQVTELSNAQLQLRDATIQSALVNGRASSLSKADLEYARARGILAVDTTAPRPPAADAPSSAAGSASTADPYGDRLRALQGEAAKLEFQTETFGRYGERVESAERALMEFATTSGDFASLLPEQKTNLLNAAQAVDEWRLKLDAAKNSVKAMNDLSEERAKLQFQVDYFGQYGEKIETAREAAMRFRVTQGDLKALAPEVKRALLDEAAAVDTLAEGYDKLARRKKEQADLAKAQIDWAAEADDVRFQAQRFSMSSFDFGQASAKRQMERELARETIGMTAEGAEEYRKARIAAFELLQMEERLARQRENTWGGGAREAIRAYGAEIEETGQSWANVWTKALKGTEDALVEFVMTGKADFKSLALSIVEDLTRIYIQQIIMAPLVKWMKEMLGTGTGSSSGGFDFMGLFGGLFDTGGGTPRFGGGPTGGGSLSFAATGAVVSGATMFRHAGGTGVMGEAGPEAIMPLRRLPSGRLGIEASGGGGRAGAGDVNIGSISVAVDAGGKSSVATDASGRKGAELGKALTTAIQEEIVKQKRPGGLLAEN